MRRVHKPWWYWTPEEDLPVARRKLVFAVVAAAGINVLLFWAPFVNGLIAGAFAGYLAGNFRRALPAIVLGSVAPGALSFVLYELLLDKTSWSHSGVYWSFLFYDFRPFWMSVFTFAGTLLGALMGLASRDVPHHRRYA